MLPIDPKKTILMYAIAFCISPALAFIGRMLDGSLLFYALETPLYAIPLGYYFTVDQCSAKETAIIAFLFGLTLTPFMIIPAGIFNFQLTDFIGFIEVGQYTMLLKMLMNTFFTVIASLFMWKASGIFREFLKNRKAPE
jgi:hypothetical protein